MRTIFREDPGGVLGAEAFDSRVQAAFLASGLVAVDQPAGHRTVDHGDGFFVGLQGLFAIAFLNQLDDFLDKGAVARRQCHIGGTVGIRLTGALSGLG